MEIQVTKAASNRESTPIVWGNQGGFSEEVNSDIGTGTLRLEGICHIGNSGRETELKGEQFSMKLEDQARGLLYMVFIGQVKYLKFHPNCN